MSEVAGSASGCVVADKWFAEGGENTDDCEKKKRKRSFKNTGLISASAASI